MAYEGNTNTGSYVTAGMYGSNALLSNLKATKTADFTGLSQNIANNRALQEQALIKGSLIKDKAKKDADVIRAKGNAIKKAGEDSKPRMAGMLAAFTLQGAGGYLAGRELKSQMNAKYENDEFFKQLRDSINGKKVEVPTDASTLTGYVDPNIGVQQAAEWRARQNSGGGTKKDSGSTTKPVTGSTITGDAGATTNTIKPVSATGTDFLSGKNLEVAEAIGATEGGKWGYDAVNQGGTAGGYKSINPGDYTTLSGGTPLTSLSIAEVMQRQSGWNDRSITDAQWRASGKGKDSKIWAAGYFQFIPSTLQSVVKSSGIDVNRPFDKSAQQELFYHHARNVGSFQPWWGTHGKGYESKYGDFFK